MIPMCGVPFPLRTSLGDHFSGIGLLIGLEGRFLQKAVLMPTRGALRRLLDQERQHIFSDVSKLEVSWRIPFSSTTLPRNFSVAQIFEMVAHTLHLLLKVRKRILIKASLVIAH
uniref:Uncharacterized protein n=1 Tax=Opuntia streptacantha TaxID=393608 RepID=A0A7C9E6X4_OPUST